LSKDLIVIAATKLAARHGYNRLTRHQIADYMGIVPSSISFHCGTMEKLRSLMVGHAIEKGIIEVLAQALADRHPLAIKAPKELKARAARLLAA
jgi:AcrR family transcriptional regulator